MDAEKFLDTVPPLVTPNCVRQHPEEEIQTQNHPRQYSTLTETKSLHTEDQT